MKIDMARIGRGIVIIFAVLCATAGLTQIPDTLPYSTKVLPMTRTMVIDTLSLIPGSVRLSYKHGERVLCRYEIVDNTLIFEDTICLHKDSLLVVQYRTLPFYIGKTYRYIDTTRLTSARRKNEYIYDYQVDPVAEGGIFGSKGVQYSGSFSRGISVGNNQDLVYDADFNMAMQGDIGDGIHIKGAIADNKLPIQPEGNTKQLSAFDRVFIELSKGPYRLLAGDYNSHSGQARFLRYNRKLLGLSFHSKANRGGWEEASKAEFAISKGKYRKQQLEVKEGNQGPYKLTGNQGERFIVVISGSEKVYYDGVPLQRGEDADYVMNYNLGEIAFTIRRPVTINSRIIVEFEYLNQQYSRTVMTTSTQWKNNKSGIYIEGYSRTDSRKPSVNFQGSFDSSAIAMLSQAPEKRGDILLSSIRPIDPLQSQSGIGYVLRDTFYTIRGIRKDTQVLVYVPGQTTQQKYAASFSEVPPGTGDYSILKTDANGRVYYWVAPDPQTGLPQGNYVPAIRITPPSTHQVVELGGTYAISKHLETTGSVAFSHLDLNRYSSLYEDNDNGMAAEAGLTWENAIYKKWTIKMHAGYGYQSKNFSTVDPYRNIEFNRYWNLPLEQETTYDEHLPQVQVVLSKSVKQTISYQMRGLFRPGVYEGRRHSWGMKWSTGPWQLESSGGIMNAVNRTETSRFLSPKARISYSGKKWETGLRFESEDNRRVENTTDTLTSASFYFRQLESYIQNRGNNPAKTRFTYTRRIDGLPDNNQMEVSSVSNQYSLRLGGVLGKHNRWSTELGYRQLDVTERLIQNTNDSKTLLGKNHLSLRLWKDALLYDGTYELNSGQEPKLEFVFVEVKPGEGQYIFTDFNHDGVPQINEYLLAPYSDTARYVKLRAFNNNFIQTNSTILQQAVTFNPSKWITIESTKRLRPWLNWTFRSIYRSDKKSKSDKWKDRINPFSGDIVDSLLVRLSYTWSNRWVYNPAGSKYDIHIGYDQNRQRLILVTGYEQNQLKEWTGKLRWNVRNNLDLTADTKYGRRQADSEVFDDRDYKIRFSEGELRANYLPQRKLKYSLIASIVEKKNESPLSEQTVQQSIAAEVNIKQSAKQSFLVNMEYASVRYSGSPGTALELIMLDGLKDGNNYLWSCQWNRKLSGNVYLKINYNGRKTGASKVFHNGTMQVRAIF